MASTMNLREHPTSIWLYRITPNRSRVARQGYALSKRTMDLTILLVALPFVLPVFLVCAVLIKIDSPNGPIIFTQKRTGKGGRPIRMYKFRTMVPNAEALKQQVAHLNELQWPDFKITDDPRITRVGKVLRKTSLDELPQLLNILKNEMSFVGPRPTSFGAHTYDLWQTERLDVQPGLLGLWQLYGRGATEFRDRLVLDIAYIERRCLWLDLQILLRSVPAVLAQRGAR
jgi:lipopolysaccharide/colanic/teichoic acid biosynthesis glycosyltransferase